MKTTGTEITEDRLNESAKEDTTLNTEEESTHSLPSNLFAQQYLAEEGGIPTDMYCPACGEEIEGSFLPMFRCPHCDILMFRDDKGNVTSYEQKHTCPECGHKFGDMTDEAPSDFRRACRNMEQKVEGVMLGLDRVVQRFLS